MSPRSRRPTLATDFVAGGRLRTSTETGKYPLTLTFTRKGDLSGDLVVDYLRVAGSLLGDSKLRLERTDAKDDQTWNYLDYWRFETVWTGRNYDDGALLIVR